MWMKSSLLLPLLAGSLFAQFSGPSLGLVYDAPNQALRRIAGLPGGATLSDPVLTGIAFAAVAPDHSFAIVSSADGSGYQLFTRDGLSALPPGLTPSARVAFSPGGGAAAFYADGSASLTLVTGLPSQPSLQAIAVGGAVGKFAVNDAGSLLVSVPRQPAGESVLQISPQGQPVQVLDVTQAAAIIFSRDGAKAWIADAAENRIWSLSQFDTSAVAAPIASDADGLSTPLALAVSTDARTLWIGNGGTNGVITFDLFQGTALASLTCSCKLTTLSPLTGAGVFRLTDLATDPIWILDASQPAPRILFIPAVAQ
ncbi:MAG: hypothetical protein JWO80_484 [Bryobacterales bacterium]|nr:hypothetical protein [Bryobacterales bacterium]